MEVTTQAVIAWWEKKFGKFRRDKIFIIKRIE